MATEKPAKAVSAVGSYAASSQARKILVVSMVLVAILGTINSIHATKDNPKPGLPHIQFWIRTGILFFILAVLVEFRPRFGGSLSAMVAVASVMQNGVGAINYFNNLGITQRKFDEEALAKADAPLPSRAKPKPKANRQRRSVSRQNATKLSHLRP